MAPRLRLFSRNCSIAPGVSCGPASQVAGLAIAYAMQCTYHHHQQLEPVQAFAHRRDP
ncbi:hypothetical protein IG631_10220 [Alternaria alternata]|nr:hypothetical protein IG631_10220 [Alternaria alternata]